MGETPQKRFKVNPVEAVILSVIMCALFLSVYNLFYGWEEIKVAAFQPQTTKGGAARNLASDSSQSFSYYRLSCQANQNVKTSASKIRLAGPICSFEISPEKQDSGRDPSSLSFTAKITGTEIVNTANRYTATVSDLTENEYSTDYIPLNSGENPIEMKFKFEGRADQTILVNIVRE